jgi:hypothetical protein
MQHLLMHNAAVGVSKVGKNLQLVHRDGRYGLAVGMPVSSKKRSQQQLCSVRLVGGNVAACQALDGKKA